MPARSAPGFPGLKIVETLLFSDRGVARIGPREPHSKVLLFDLGVRNAILRRPLDRPFDDERRLLLEHLVGLEL